MCCVTAPPSQKAVLRIWQKEFAYIEWYSQVIISISCHGLNQCSEQQRGKRMTVQIMQEKSLLFKMVCAFENGILFNKSVVCSIISPGEKQE
jgi:hypothetical protein